MKKNKPKKSLSQSEIVVLSVYLLGGAEQSIDTEDVAIQSNSIAPGRFAWRKYPNQINLEVVRVCLSHAKRPEDGSFIQGSGQSGWQLTTNGLKLARKLLKNIDNTQLIPIKSSTDIYSVDKARESRERNRILSSVAWGKWVQGNKDITLSEINDVFRIDSYANEQLQSAKIVRLANIFYDDEHIGPFIEHINQQLESIATKES